MDHDKLIAAAKQALEDLFSDASVPPYRTIGDLEDLITEIQGMIDSINAVD
jgi:hypothetical protein